VKNRNPLVITSSFVLFFLIVLASCKKINEATELGSDLIPVVDNINTFADTLAVETYNELFTELNDSTRILNTDIHYLGQMNNDPLFGRTTASIFLELKPSSYKYSFEDHDAITIDSVVLVLNFRDLYGDSTLPQQVVVKEIDQTNDFRRDSLYLINGTPFTTNTRTLGSKTFLPLSLNDSIKGFREQAANQLRIRLDDAFGQELLMYDSTNAYYSDSAFRKHFKGFAILPQGAGGNAVMGFQLADTNTKLAIYYHYVKGTKKDTTVRNFYFNSMTHASANFVNREHAAGQINNYLTNGVDPDQFGFIQNTPGTYVRVKIPGLANLSNRVIHRAELIVQQVADPTSDPLFPASPFLFIDALIPDGNSNSEDDKYKAIPYDLSFNSDGSLNLGGLGAISSKSFDPGGNSISVWRLNLSRYVQNVVNQREAVTDFRLSSPFFGRFSLQGTSQIFRPQINPTSTKYRVRVGGGNHPTQPMRLRIVYSNIQ